MRCAVISRKFDLRSYYGKALAKIADRIESIDHPVTDGAEAVRIALAWHPHPDAFERYPNLKAVCTIGAGADNVLACPSLPPHVNVVRVVDPAQAEMMAGFVAWHVIWHQRKFATYMQQQRDRIWRRLEQRPASDVPVSILGYGKIGERVATQLAGLGFPVNVWSRTPKSAAPGLRAFAGRNGLFAMLAETEVLVNLLPLTPETRGLIDAEVFSAMKHGGYLIQTGRGEQMVEADLLAALENGQLSGASLDVFAVEPLPADHIFWHHPQILMTPHDACDVSFTAVANTLVATAAAIEAGEIPPHAVDRSRGY
ncbi:MAG: glyoxylate/hydroxypyruvate reductase A [Ferrovibrio sp.]|uniref:2-hydroxyacid dehydrogenase n=1 Tax=Ferrovibrio sp. TaxID=1917215 RepID=UPI002633E880|nr:glyoxylate/hydroxypyruvate reductase A [Ferrovibrio sp.]MCW0234014.1 glyoxylate/hydroxypyruvate reductase A [Ferrovibrio sp.]